MCSLWSLKSARTTPPYPAAEVIYDRRPARQLFGCRVAFHRWCRVGEQVRNISCHGFSHRSWRYHLTGSAGWLVDRHRARPLRSSGWTNRVSHTGVTRGRRNNLTANAAELRARWTPVSLPRCKDCQKGLTNWGYLSGSPARTPCCVT